MIRPNDEGLNLSSVAHLHYVRPSALSDYAAGPSVEAPMGHSLMYRGVDDDVHVVSRLIIDEPGSNGDLTTLPRMTREDLPAPAPKPVRLHDHSSGITEAL